MTTINGTNNDDNLIGTADGDSISALGGNDTIDSGLGDDFIDGGAGFDTIDGGAGIDTVSYATAAGSLEISLRFGFVDEFDAGGNEAVSFDTLTNIENANGSVFADVITGTDGDNVLQGLGGDDFIDGRAGNDVLLGGDDNDFLRGGAGFDTIDGGAGIDTVSYSTATDGPVEVNLRLGFANEFNADGSEFVGIDRLTNIENANGSVFADIIIGADGDNVLQGLGGDDFIDGGAGNDMLFGGNDDDFLRGGAGFDTIDGGAGIDTVSYSTATDGPVEINLRLGFADELNADGSEIVSFDRLTNIENANGSVFADVITGTDGDNVLQGLGGDDFIDGGAGNDVLLGGNDNDLLRGGAGNNTLDGGAGIDTASYTTASDSVLVVLGSADGLTDGTADSADGTDTIRAVENVSGSAFDDVIFGNDADNALTAGDGNDFMRGRAGNDTLAGGNGDDFLDGGQGNDTLNGGNGLDRVSYAAGATAGVMVNLNLQGVAQNTGGSGIDTLTSIEHVSGTIFSDTITGDGGNNWLWGGSDGSVVTGNDTINGGAGNDLVEVGSGNHTLVGGTGIDTLSLWGNATDITAAGVTFSLRLQGAVQDTEQGMMNAIGFENVSGSRYDDVISGNGGSNILLGDTGSDSLIAGDGNDTLYGDGRIIADTHGTGGSGPVTLYGDVERDFDSSTGLDGNDTLNGGRGNDTFYGGRGNDVMTGGNDADSFVIEGQSGHDRITDFTHVDKIVFDALSGADDFSDLILTAVGKGTLVSWGTGDDVLVDGIAPDQLTAADFIFGSSAAASSAAVLDPLNHGSGFHTDMAMDHAAIDMASTSFLAG